MSAGKLWSLGNIVYETLTGARPFDGGSFVGVGAAVLKGKYRPASELRFRSAALQKPQLLSHRHRWPKLVRAPMPY